MRIVPKSLRVWFIVHFVVDFLFAILLFIIPTRMLALFGFEDINILFARLVAAALFAIGGASLVVHKQGVDSYNALLSVKVIWSILAILALVLALIESWSISVVAILIIFIIFSVTWVYYKRGLLNV